MDDKLLKIIKEKKAKPEESIFEHSEKLRKCANKLYEYKYISKDDFISLDKACENHDLGKINPLFQDRINASINGRRKKFNSNEEAPHNILSYFLLDADIIEDFENSYNIIYIVINHHKKVNNLEYIGKNIGIIKDNLKLISEEYNISYYYDSDYMDILDEVDKLVSRSKSKTDILLGLLNKCDYAASAGIKIEFAPDFLEESMNRMMQKWQKSSKEAKWNEMQEYCYNHQNENLIVIAATGSGKTEAALRWIGNNKGFFVLPLKTAINAIYQRVENEILEKENINERLGLLHGDTLDIYIKENEESLIENNQILNYLDRTRMYSLPLNISTPDQLFTFIFKSKGYELKYAMLSYSKIVIDEIQAYSPEILAAVIYGIHKIIDAGGQVSVFTATLPPFVEKFLNNSIVGNKFVDKNYFNKFPENSIFVDKDQIRHSIKAYEKELVAEDIIKHYRKNKGQYKKYLVVCNTVKKAQEMYLTLRDEGFENVYLLHSKFIKKDRKSKEDRIMEDGETFETDGNLKKSDVIWISTQIVEASLDIDFDYLFTELSDLNSLFQRMGRINRKGKKEVKSENCYVFTEINKKILHKKGSVMGFIDNGIYELCKGAILKFTENKNIITEREKYDLINSYLTFEKLEESGSSFIEEYLENYNRLNTLNNYDITINDNFRDIISFDAIPVDEEKGNINESEIKNLIEEYESLNRKDSDYFLKYSEIKRKLKQLTVSVGLYDKREGEKIPPDIKIVKSKLIEDNNILYLYCRYDSELGYVRINRKNKSEIEKEQEDSDIFI